MTKPDPPVSTEHARESLAAARAALGWSRPVAAEHAGVHRNTILAWETADESWGPRVNYLTVLLHSRSRVARETILRLLDLAGRDVLGRDADPAFVDLMRATYARRKEPAVARALELLAVLVDQ